MKNQRKKAPKRQVQNCWQHEFKSAQKARHTDDLNHIKVSHRKPLKKGK